MVYFQHIKSFILYRDVDPVWSYADPDPPNLVNADPDPDPVSNPDPNPGRIQDKKLPNFQKVNNDFKF